MNLLNQDNLNNIKGIFEAKTGVELTTRKSVRRPISATVALVAAITCCLTMTAFAANYFSDGAILRYFQFGAFGENHENELNDTQLLTIENYTTHINQSVECNGTTVTLKSVTGAVTSKNYISYFVFEVETPENALESIDNDDLSFERIFVSFDDSIERYGASFNLFVMDDEQGRKNVKTVVLSRIENANECIETVRMNLSLKNFWQEQTRFMDEEEARESGIGEITEGVWSFDLDLSLNMGIMIAGEPPQDESAVDLKSIELSPLGGNYIYSNCERVENFLVEIVMLDGSSISVFNEGGIYFDETMTEIVNFIFDTPTDLTAADYALFADGTRIEIK